METRLGGSVPGWRRKEEAKLDSGRNVVVKTQIMQAKPGVCADGALLACVAGMMLSGINS
jgi:hypothetical protein